MGHQQADKGHRPGQCHGSARQQQDHEQAERPDTVDLQTKAAGNIVTKAQQGDLPG